MLTQEQAVEIRVLERQGRSIRQIMRDTGLSRNTVRKYLRGGKVEYGPREPRACKLDPYKSYLLERIEQARPDWIPATVLMREIGAMGYSGGISQLKAYLRAFKVVRADPVVRFETAPGQQMQADFTTIRRGRDRLLAFVATLGFSRATFVRFTCTEQFEDWRDGLIAAFDYFGGVPREVLFDNTKTVIIERDGYGPGLHRWHAGMLELARDCGFQLRVCRPYRACTKGKVERFNGYLKGSFLVPLAATLRAGGLQLDVDTANREVLRWLNEVANTRIHATTGVQPCVRLIEDRAQLSALPSRTMQSSPAISPASVVPFESLQHPLSVYQALLENAA
ncbi:IS21 family transposase [Steroidobacter agaridevorans]|uniref:IS21 family transposase n=1 Tax=Steroidobacter agaridevorans TaxID=2695856 RepID=A0A829YNK1_9GAMM|nr:IS21 family transposase [Steroidobacter agaridevorans]GFE85044.1 IS21 family transposase [Steroidobacter agaridevorans]GFE91938.1 IS21 family transposase [Steroidobacter agaridevorans]